MADDFDVQGLNLLAEELERDDNVAWITVKSAVAAHAALAAALPAGERQEIVSFRVVDPRGILRARGLASQAQADALAAAMAREQGEAFEVVRCAYVAFTHLETVATFEPEAAQ